MSKKPVVSKKMLFTWFMLVGLIFLFAPQSMTYKFQSAFSYMFRWPLSLGRAVSLSSTDHNPSLTEYVPRREYEKLQNHLDSVIEQLYQQHQTIQELQGIRDRFGLEGAQLITADIIKQTSTHAASELIINRGSLDGLNESSFVIGDNSIIGTIANVDDRTAKVKLITDTSSTIKVKLSSLESECILKGTGDNKARITMVPVRNKISVNDKVYVQKKPGILDVPFKLGTVSKCVPSIDNPLLWDITVEPACDVKQLQSVAVIIMNPKGN